jgi:hypothetical protein
MRYTWCLVVGIGMICFERAAAWNDSGHRAIARWAWRELPDRERAYFSKLLSHHPHYTIYLMAEKPETVSEVEWAFIRAATWADWLREPRSPSLSESAAQQIRAEYHKPSWHYVNLPIIAPDDANRFDRAEIQKRVLQPPVDLRGEPRHIIAALHYTMKRLQAPDLPEDERAIALAWLMHLVGDLHQPLHATALLSSRMNFEPPSGDQGGNRIAVKIAADDRRAFRLHSYWDSIPLPHRLDFQAIDQTVLVWREATPKRLSKEALKLNDFLAWAEESRELALNAVYRQGTDWIPFKPLPAGLVELEGLDAPVLSMTYRQQAEDLARQRQIIAGQRLTGQLMLVMNPNR